MRLVSRPYIQLTIPTARKLKLQSDPVFAICIKERLVRKEMATEGTLIVSCGVMKAIEPDGTLRTLVLRFISPRAESVWVRVWKSRVAVEIVSGHHLEPIGKRFNLLLPVIMGQASVQEVVAGKMLVPTPSDYGESRGS